MGIAPEVFDDDMLDRVQSATDSLSRPGPLSTYVDRRREAMVQRSFEGNNRMALIALGVAGEVLLDTVLLHMLWEEHTTPGDAADFFDRRTGHTARVGRHFPGRLGGGWHPDAPSPAGGYLRDLVQLRNRSVHAGHDPTREELDGWWCHPGPGTCRRPGGAHPATAEPP